MTSYRAPLATGVSGAVGPVSHQSALAGAVRTAAPASVRAITLPTRKIDDRVPAAVPVTITQAKSRRGSRPRNRMVQAGNIVELRSPGRDDSRWGAVAMLAYDDEFLYIGVSCSRAESFRYDSSDRPRPRDSDLSDHDRVELLLDVDRDFATYYRLTIDHRGWTGESCWHDATWNPTWFVATGGDDETWTAEAAIPLSQLAGQMPEAGTSWAVGVQRIVPGVGFQSWTAPAAPEVIPEGMGYLIFGQ